MPQNKNPIQQQIEQERSKSPANDLTPKEIAHKVGNLARAEGVRANKHKISQGVKNAFADPVIRERHLKAIKDFAATAEHKEKNRRAQETRVTNGSIEKLIAGTKALRADPIRSAELNKKSRAGLEKAKETDLYWTNYYAGIERRESDKSYHKDRIAKANAVICRRVHTPLGDFDSITLAAKAHDMGNTETMRHRLKSPNFPEYYLLDDNLRPKKK